MKRIVRLVALLTACALLLPLPALAKASAIQLNAADYPVEQAGQYTSMEEVAVYLAAFGHLPTNFITKKQAQALGWNSREGNLSAVAPGKSIGGDYFGNYEGNVPDAKGRSWTECDIDADGGFRNGKRIVFSSDGLIYYSDDHYASFTQVLVTAAPQSSGTSPGAQGGETGAAPAEDGQYTAADDVAAYLHAYGHLPDNYLTRDQAKALGWSSKKDNLSAVAPGCAIGGDSFGNREGLLPAKKGRVWQECDVNVENGRRSDERLVYSNDGLIYYTPDAHRSFERLY